MDLCELKGGSSISHVYIHLVGYNLQVYFFRVTLMTTHTHMLMEWFIGNKNLILYNRILNLDMLIIQILPFLESSIFRPSTIQLFHVFSC
ncbi:hypothetical protein ACJX0J_010937, partial [Zea mays]